MTSRTRLATAAALAAVVAVGVPAFAHAPRDGRPGAPTMDLEVLVTPPVTGRTTPGGTDAVVAVDAFGNRFAVARKEDVQSAVGVDQRARTAVRASAWQWFSEDEGSSWTNLETLPRGAEVALPQGLHRDLASAGPSTYFAESTAAGTLVTRVVATKRGRVSALAPSLVPAPTSRSGRTSIAAAGSTVALAVSTATGSTVAVSTDGAASWAPTRAVAADACDAALGRLGRAVTIACLRGGSVVLLSSRDAGAGFTERVLGPADRRGGDSAAPSVDIAPDGTVHVLSGLRLWSLGPSGRVRSQDLQTEGTVHRSTTMAVSSLGRVGVGAYRRTAEGAWHVVVTVFTPGKAPVWSDFANHDPAAPEGAAAPPSDRLSVDFDPRGRVHLVWTATFLHEETLDRPLLRNVWSVRSTTS